MAALLFVIVPGILHTPSHFQPLRTHLERRGHEVRCVALPNIGENALDAAPWDDAKAVRKILEDSIISNGRDVVLVCHSYGGVPGCQAVLGLEKSARQVQGERGGITHVIFLNAFIVMEGESTLDTLISIGQPAPLWIEADPSNDRLVRHTSLVGQYLYNDLDETSRTEWVDKLLPINVNHRTTPVKSSCWQSPIPKRCVIGSADKAVWPSTQRAMLEQVRDETWSVEEIDSGHSPFLSQPEELADLLIARVQ